VIIPQLEDFKQAFEDYVRQQSQDTTVALQPQTRSATWRPAIEDGREIVVNIPQSVPEEAPRGAVSGTGRTRGSTCGTVAIRPRGGGDASGSVSVPEPVQEPVPEPVPEPASGSGSGSALAETVQQAWARLHKGRGGKPDRFRKLAQAWISYFSYEELYKYVGVSPNLTAEMAIMERLDAGINALFDPRFIYGRVAERGGDVGTQSKAVQMLMNVGSFTNVNRVVKEWLEVDKNSLAMNLRRSSRGKVPVAGKDETRRRR
jgi:hypothetical protein